MKKKDKEGELSFFAKVILLSRLLKQKLSEIKPVERINKKQKSLAMYEGKNSPENVKLSYYFGISRVISLFLIAILLVVTILFGGSIISYENVYYMFKDIGYVNSFSEGRPSSLSYSKPVQNQEFAVFKGGLAAVSDSEIKFFTSTGRATLTKGSEYTNPKIDCSENTALIYDQGRKGFSIYNSFINLYSEQLDSPISCADMSQSGGFLVVTETAKYKSVVKIYNKDYSITNEYSKNDLVVSAKLNDSGRYAAVLSIRAKGGESEACLNVLDCKKNEIVSETVFSGRMPYFCEFLTDDRIALFFDDAIFFVDRSGKTQGSYEYPSSLEYVSVDKDMILLAFQRSGISSGNIVTVLDKNGNVLLIDSITGTLTDAKLSSNNIYLLREHSVLRIDVTTRASSEKSVVANEAKLIVFNDGEVAVCSPGVMNYISFN